MAGTPLLVASIVERVEIYRTDAGGEIAITLSCGHVIKGPVNGTQIHVPGDAMTCEDCSRAWAEKQMPTWAVELGHLHLYRLFSHGPWSFIDDKGDEYVWVGGKEQP